MNDTPAAEEPDRQNAIAAPPAVDKPAGIAEEPAEDLGIDLDALKQAMGRTLGDQAVDTPPATKLDHLADLCEEVAEDMLELIRRLQSIEEQQAEAAQRLLNLEQQTGGSVRALGRELAGLRRDLIGEQKAILARGAFHAVVASLDSVQIMRAGLDPEQDERTIRQLIAVEATLATTIQGLGFARFDIEPGAAFDPGRMECLGYADGEPGTVVEAVRPGYAADDIVIRPAGAILSRPRSTDDETPAEGTEDGEQ